MRIITLIENTPGEEGCLYEHGLSFYLETDKHKLLMDTGATDAFLTNAESLGIDLKQVDTIVLSHGHYDHSGGLCLLVASTGLPGFICRARQGQIITVSMKAERST